MDSQVDLVDLQKPGPSTSADFQYYADFRASLDAEIMSLWGKGKELGQKNDRQK